MDGAFHCRLHGIGHRTCGPERPRGPVTNSLALSPRATEKRFGSARFSLPLTARIAAPARNALRTRQRPTTNDTTCGPPAWLTGKLQNRGTRSVRSPLRWGPLLATPIATPLQGGRPERPGLLFLTLLLLGMCAVVGFLCSSPRWTIQMYGLLKGAECPK